jgi:hypothetical protein
MISKLLEALHKKVFINIIVKDACTDVYLEVLSNGNVLNSSEKSFDTTGINKKMRKYIETCIEESPFYYISILDNSALQGAVPTSQMNQHEGMDTVKSVTLDEWTAYSQEDDINTLKNEYKIVGVDFIFSPFLIISQFFKDKIKSTLSMFILVNGNYLSIAIFDNSKLLYAQHLDIKQQDDNLLINPSLYEDALLGMEDIDLENIDIDDESLEEFGNIEDLDTNNEIKDLDTSGEIEDLDTSGEIEEFSEEKDIEEVSEKNEIDSDALNEDYQRFILIQGSLNSFYKNDKYESKFIESVYIADGVGVSSTLKGYLEEEMFLSVYIRKIDLGMAVCDTAKAELDAI